MPTLLVWMYEGGQDGNEHRGTRRVFPDELGIDDLLDEVKIIAMEGSYLLVEARNAKDELCTMKRTSGHIRAKINREAAEIRPATGRPGQKQGGILSFFGGGSATPSPPAKQLAKNTKGLGGRIKTPVAAAAARGRDKQRAPLPSPASEDSDAEGSGSGAVAGAVATHTAHDAHTTHAAQTISYPHCWRRHGRPRGAGRRIRRR